MAAKGIQVTRATASGHTIAVYTVLEKGFSEPLTLRALDAKQMEVGRAQAKVKEAAGTAKYIEFPFDKHTPMSAVATFELR